jgi:hypothetical protein
MIKNLLHFLLNKFQIFLISKIKKTKNFTLSKFLILLAQYVLLKSRSNYKKYNLIEDAEIRVFSQNGEDGIIDYIIQQLNLKKPNFIEIGVGDYLEANTRLVYEMYNSRGLIIDINKNLKEKISINVNLWKGNLSIIEEKVSSKNINNLLEKFAPTFVDIFSIDIDSVDYWVVEKIKERFSKIFILEYNSVFGPKLEVSVPDIEDFSREEYHYSNLCYGASLKAYIKLMDQKGYYLLGVNRFRNNAFFINKEFSKDLFFPNISELDLHELTNANFSESRNKSKNLSYLSRKEQINEIIDCEVVNLKDNKKLKIRNLIHN